MNNNQQTVDEVITQRHSVRAFLPRPVPRSTLEELLTVASHAPSSANIQPWKVYVVTGSAQAKLKTELYNVFINSEQNQKHTAELKYYPEEWVSPYKDRRTELGIHLYKTLGIEKNNRLAMQQQQARNMLFFDAPVTLIFTIDKCLEDGSLVDCGMFIQSVMLAAQARGLGTCAQASVNQFHQIIKSQLNIPDSEKLLCGLSLGFEDITHKVNTVRSTRAPLEVFAKFIDN